MKKLLLGIVASITAAGVHCALAADLPTTTLLLPVPIAFSWTGWYAGVTAGGAWGQFDPRTSTGANGYLNAAQAAAVNAAGTQSIKTAGFTTGIEGGYNWQTGNVLLGVEADLQAVHLNRATNSGAVPYPGAALSFTVTSYGNSNWLFTARPRIGYVAPNNWLFYATGGLAVTKLQTDFAFDDNNGAEESGKVNTIKAGYAAGGGIEAPLSNNLSVKADYLHVAFANTAGQSTASNLLLGFPGQVFSHSSDLKADIFRVGLNYRFSGANASSGSGAIMAAKAPVWKAQPPVFKDWEVETGARVWFSSGRDGGIQPLDVPGPTLASRLIFSGLDAVTGETFARVDHVSGLFVKGYLGAGGINSGHENDEDFPAGIAYSNTLQSTSGHIGYATIDVGYNFLKAPGASVGAFVGYNYLMQQINEYGCAQLAGSNACAPPLASALLVGSNTDYFNSLRVGLASRVMLTDRVKLTADAAWVPLVTYSGVDDHLLRQLYEPLASHSGDGVMLEAMLDYAITPAWSVGVGGRYWAWNMNTGSDTFIPLTGGATTVEQARFSTDRYGVFAQTSYHWGDPAPAAARAGMTTKAPVLASGPMNWTGIYVGGHIGGGVSHGTWSDPFPSAPSGLGGINVAGFGDTTQATGPLGGGQIGANWQTGAWVLGLQADASGAHMRGENTCFSGLGGINCAHTVNAVGTFTGRVGFAWDRSLAYVKAGGALTDTTYNLFGNTFNVALGAGSTSLDTWGWTAGGGIEYALTNHWTTFVEYDHVGVPATTVPFPTVAVVNTQNISVKQSVDLFKMGVNYKFDWATQMAASK